MFKEITSIDQDLFFAINGTHSFFTDCVMWLYSGRLVWIPITLFLIGFIIYKKNWKEWLPVLVAFVILFLLSDKISSDIIKPVSYTHLIHVPKTAEMFFNKPYNIGFLIIGFVVYHLKG